MKQTETIRVKGTKCNLKPYSGFTITTRDYDQGMEKTAVKQTIEDYTGKITHCEKKSYNGFLALHKREVDKEIKSLNDNNLSMKQKEKGTRKFIRFDKDGNKVKEIVVRI